ncbi:MAG TPA: protein kinase [Terriglobia bacterium]|nr:protein kinase [Terriglobia bacterium]
MRSDDESDITQWQSTAPEGLGPGDTIGPYRIESMIGRGGMGSVFRAVDSRLNRKVAVKLCDARFAERFEREAKAISALNHPHICTLYDIGPNYLVMELIEGETLASKIRQGPMRLEDVLRYGAEIADALSEAHAAGIIHRDLKPGNIMVTGRGIKVLDFGLAKEAGPGIDWTQSFPLAGTPAYMAPEQIRGGVNPRTDLFSLGLILFEMVTGRLPFPGASLGNMLASDDSAIIPSPSRFRDATFSPLDPLISNLLAATPEKRISSASVVRDTLRSLDSPTIGNRKVMKVVVAAVVLAVAITGAALWWMVKSKQPIRWEVASLVEFLPSPNAKVDPAFSPDCSLLAFSWSGKAGDKPGIYVASVSGGEPRQLTETDGRDASPSWSRDGTQIAFQRVHQGRPSQLMLVDATDGSIKVLREVTLASDISTTELAWTGDGKGLVVAMRDPETQGEDLFRVSLGGGAPQRVLKAGKTSRSNPSVSPDGTWLSYVDNYVVHVQRVASDGSLQGDPLAISGEGECCIESLRWSPDNSRLLFLSGNRRRILVWDAAGRNVSTAYVAPFGLQAMSACGAGSDPPRVAFSVSAGQMEMRTLELLDQGRKAGSNQLISRGPLSGAYSRDGRWIAFAQSGDLWMADAEGRQARRLTTSGGFLREPLWSRDGRHIAFHSRRTAGNPQIYILDLDPAAVMARSPDAAPNNPLRRLVETSYPLVSPQWSSDGNYLFATSPPRLKRIPASGGEVEDLFESAASRLDPSGRYIYYFKTNQSGLFKRSLDGDLRYNPEERVLNDGFSGAGFDVTENGVIYIGLDKAGNPEAIRFYDFGLKRSFDLAPAPPPGGSMLTLRVSPDGRRLLYDTPDQAAGNLMLMQFRNPS